MRIHHDLEVGTSFIEQSQYIQGILSCYGMAGTVTHQDTIPARISRQTDNSLLVLLLRGHWIHQLCCYATRYQFCSKAPCTICWHNPIEGIKHFNISCDIWLDVPNDESCIPGATRALSVIQMRTGFRTVRIGARYLGTHSFAQGGVGADLLAQHPVNHADTEHIDICCHFIWECITDRSVDSEPMTWSRV